MPPKPFFTEEHIEPVSRLLKEGLSFRQIAAEYGCDKNTVAQFVRTRIPELMPLRAGNYASANRVTGLRILILDIETIAGTVRQWNSYQRFTNPEMIVHDTELFCFAAKWLGEAEVEFRSVHHDGRAKMVQRAHALLSEADGVVTFNGDRFDLPHLNLEVLRSGMAPPAPYKSVDLIKTIKRKFRFHNNKLMRVSKTLGIGAKIEHEGWPLWEKCEAGDTAAWERMREYNIGDVRLTEDLYLWLRPWIEGHPSHAAYHLDDVCVTCGSEELRERGVYRTKTGTYPRFQCEACGKWQRGTHRTFAAELTETAMS